MSDHVYMNDIPSPSNMEEDIYVDPFAPVPPRAIPTQVAPSGRRVQPIPTQAAPSGMTVQPRPTQTALSERTVQPIPTQAALSKRTVQRPESGAYALAGGGRVVYDLSNRTASIESPHEQITSCSWFMCHWKMVGAAILIIVVLGTATGVGFKLGAFDKLLGKSNGEDSGR